MDGTKLLISLGSHESTISYVFITDQKAFQPNIIIAGVVNIPECLAIAQKLNIQLFIAATIPFFSSAELPVVTVLSEPLSVGFMNKFTHWAAFKAQWLLLGKYVNAFRQNVLGLPAASANDFEHLVCLGAYSNHVQPFPKDYPDWVVHTGYWILPPKEEYIAPKEITSFLSSGDAPVYFGFDRVFCSH